MWPDSAQLTLGAANSQTQGEDAKKVSGRWPAHSCPVIQTEGEKDMDTSPLIIKAYIDVMVAERLREAEHREHRTTARGRSLGTRHAPGRLSRLLDAITLKESSWTSAGHS
jgi:hypothetical protein